MQVWLVPEMQKEFDLMTSGDSSSFTAVENELLRLGIKQFNEQSFFACHETLEKLWLGQSGEKKELIQGLIQVAVAYHHLAKGNAKGAAKLFKRGLDRLQANKPENIGLDLTDFCQTIKENLQQLEGRRGGSIVIAHIAQHLG